MLQDSDRSAILRMVLLGLVDVLVMLIAIYVGGFRQSMERAAEERRKNDYAITALRDNIAGLRDQALVMHNNVNRLESILTRVSDQYNTLMTAYIREVTAVDYPRRNGR